MHLDHKIPWNTTASHFKYIKSNPHITPHTTDLFARDLPSQSNDLNHFRRVLIATIREFGLTQERKAPDVSGIPDPGPLFSETLLSYPERRYGLGPHTTNSAFDNPFSDRYQNLEYWIHRAASPDDPDYLGYGTGDADLAEAVKMLITIVAEGEPDVSSEAQGALLRLMRHPRIPLHDLWNLHWGHSFGVDHVAHRALEMYISLNVFGAVFEKKPLSGDDSALFASKTFQRYLNHAVANYDYPAQNIPHRAFWQSLGLPIDGEGENDSTVKDPLDAHSTDDTRDKLKAYLKLCFTILYVFDTCQRELLKDDPTVDREWSYMITGVLLWWGCDHDWETMEFVQKTRE
ncbi:hypothetical protein P170DRAFT_409420 [Aspergillus steynii IBT 23096]|uniref:Uncharacterized protein n=1 Tax=Aspergillus steynii IBT 23096 TaxID=1392250 RepID=A0A2I2GAA7_9EURO|nr:uncharacterized protein P170DRAFT_409420 [Aspergillus steynii IBT 23096]PLB49811.1 hypothetical protein P170DRAFT_409420 [Aspergillus steynii IBT 23096]